MDLKDIKTLKEVSQEYGISIFTLQDRLKNLIEWVDYRKLGKGQATLLMPTGVKKIVQGLHTKEEKEAINKLRKGLREQGQTHSLTKDL